VPQPSLCRSPEADQGDIAEPYSGSTIEHLRGRGNDEVAAEVDVERHRRIRMTELIRDLTGRDAGFVESRRGLPAHVSVKG
jgi:hypothetical protein